MIVDRLCEISERARRPALEWPESFSGWAMSPELVSLYDTPTWHALDEERQRTLAFFEAVNFFSLNIHGERALMEGLSRRLYRGPHSAYVHHFLDEENQHMRMFGRFCLSYAGKIYPEKKLSFQRPYEPGEEDFLFYAKVLIFEELVDSYNVTMSRDTRLAPIARQINLRHHLDETRHLTFGRLVVKELWERLSPAWPESTVAAARSYLAAYLEATWRGYYHPEVYRDAGFSEPYAVRGEALASPYAAALRTGFSEKCRRFFQQVGIFVEERR